VYQAPQEIVLRGLVPRETTFKFEFLREFEPEFEIILGYELGAHMGPIHEKNHSPKISCYCTFKLGSKLLLFFKVATKYMLRL
jgi:hypothetical protein